MEERYARNLPALSEADCAALRKKHVCIVGCGGLGGTIIELLARIGVGALTVVDGDVFDETNLNRQLLSDVTVLGQNKAETARARVEQVNPDVTVRAVPEFLTAENAGHILAGADLAIDALDSAQARRILAGACAEAGLYMVHGAIGGWHAQATVVAPGDGVIGRLYPPRAPAAPKKGNLSFVAAVCASVEAAEAVKLLCGRPAALQGKLELMDLMTLTFTTLDIQ